MHSKNTIIIENSRILYPIINKTIDCHDIVWIKNIGTEDLLVDIPLFPVLIEYCE